MYCRGYKLYLSLALSTIIVLHRFSGTRRGAFFLGHFDGHRTMHSRHRDHRSIAKAQGNNRCPGRWLSRLITLALAAERLARIFCSCFCGFWLVVLCFFYVVLCFCGIKKTIHKSNPLFDTIKLGLLPSGALFWRAKIVALDVSYNLASSTALEVKNSRRYILFREANLKWTYIYVHNWIAVKYPVRSLNTWGTFSKYHMALLDMTWYHVPWEQDLHVMNSCS